MHRQRIARSKEECCTGNSVVVCLHRDTQGVTKGWYIGPLFVENDRVRLHYLPKEHSVLGPVALVRALDLARRLEKELVIYDPDRLLAKSWAF